MDFLFIQYQLGTYSTVAQIVGLIGVDKQKISHLEYLHLSIFTLK